MLLVKSDNLFQVVPEQSHSHRSFSRRESLAKLSVELGEKILQFCRRLENMLVVNTGGKASESQENQYLHVVRFGVDLMDRLRGAEFL